MSMIGSYVKVALRHLWRQKGYSLLNIVGLALGMTCCLFLALYVFGELSYDTQIPDADHIFRIVTEVRLPDESEYTAGTPVPLGPALQREIPEIRSVVRFWEAEREVVRSQGKAFREEGFYFADHQAFTQFRFPLISGDPTTVLSTPNSIVLTESAARRYFGRENPIGQILTVDGYPVENVSLTVTGVMRDHPPNSQFAFRFLASIAGVTTEQENWGSTKSIWTYVQLEEGARTTELESKLTAFGARHFEGRYLNQTRTLHLEPLRDVHLHSRYAGGFKPAGNMASLYLLSLIGVLITLLASVNFVNLSTALAFTRMKEVGVRKVLGAARIHIAGQFLVEAVLVTAGALIVTLVAAEALLPLFNAMAGTQLIMNTASGTALGVLLPGMLLVVALLSGIYPALFLANTGPLVMLRRWSAFGKQGVTARKALVILQFVASTGLIVATVVIHQQLSFIRAKDLGITRDRIVVVPYTQAEDVLRASLLQNPHILAVCTSQRVPVNTLNEDSRPLDVGGKASRQQMQSYIVDTHFLETYGIRLLAGQHLPERAPEGETPFLVNETAVKRLGWRLPQEAIGTPVRWSGTYKSGHIVGVVSDFNLSSLREPVQPLVLLSIPESQWWRTFISIRIRPEETTETLKFIQDSWRRLAPEGAFESFFIDESLGMLHRDDEGLGQVISAFAAIAVIISCLGLFGLSVFAARQRTKEIGIRKVLGASTAGVITLLSKDFLLLVVVASLIAWPAAWYVMNRWLENFAYRIAIGWWVFAAAGGTALLVVLLTVSFQAVKAALANPVEALRHE